ncbi:MAG: hypothetical protein R3261_10555, partial [Alphaproteobacteria bacterium]|nr:hypothetical protein [Alphaproteobacteria bacterium]
MSLNRKREPQAAALSKLSAIRQNRDRYISFAFASAHLFVEIDRSGKITYAAGAAGALERNGASALLGHKFIRYIAFRDREYFQEILTHLFIHHRIEPRPIVINTASGHEM